MSEETDKANVEMINALLKSKKQLQAENKSLREANIDYETTIMATSAYLRHAKECPLNMFVGLIDKDAPLCTCGLHKATGYEQVLKNETDSTGND